MRFFCYCSYFAVYIWGWNMGYYIFLNLKSGWWVFLLKKAQRQSLKNKKSADFGLIALLLALFFQLFILSIA